MSACDTCRAPGSCCKGFILNRGYSAEDWKAEAEADMERHGVPYFKPVRSVEPLPSVHGPGRVSVFFDCDRVGQDGRCTQYDNRPHTCRAFIAGSDPLCAEHVQTLRGIPIRLVAR